MIEFIQMTDTRQDFVNALQQVYHDGVYPGYPPHSDRLVINKDRLDYNWMGRLMMPSGAWDIPDSSDKQCAGEPPTLAQQERFLLQGLLLDNLGRPMHPYAVDLLTNRKLGALCNRGYYRQWGPNQTVDMVVVTQDTNKVLLQQRADNGAWALPGGFLDPNERTDVAASRETFEETAVNLNIRRFTKLTNKQPIADERLTLNAWPVTTCYSTAVPKELPCRKSAESLAVDWVPIDDALNGQLVAGHIPLLKAALKTF